MEPSLYFKNIFNHSNFAPLTHRLWLKNIPIEGLKYKSILFDLHCPSLKKKKLSNGICNKCNKILTKRGCNQTAQESTQKTNDKE